MVAMPKDCTAKSTQILQYFSKESMALGSRVQRLGLVVYGLMDKGLV